MKTQGEKNRDRAIERQRDREIERQRDTGTERQREKQRGGETHSKGERITRWASDTHTGRERTERRGESERARDR